MVTMSALTVTIILVIGDDDECGDSGNKCTLVAVMMMS
jgi:hypothetical protein